MAQGFASPIYRAESELKKLGISIVDNNPDLTLIQIAKINEKEAEKEVKRATSPVAMLEFTNSVDLNWYHLLQYPKVKGYIKGQIYTPVDNVYVGWNMALIKMKGNDYTNNMTYFDLDRDIDIHYSATISPKNPFPDDQVVERKIQAYVSHRELASMTLDHICHKHGFSQSGKCKADDYINKMKRSKICLSPWGTGELCHRTFEAIRLGAIPITPDSNHIKTWPNIFTPESYVKCNYDFSNLEEIIVRILNHYDSYKSIPMNAYNIVKEAWDNNVFAKRFKMIMEEIYEN
jgi:hypothetical protein